MITRNSTRLLVTLAQCKWIKLFARCTLSILWHHAIVFNNWNEAFNKICRHSIWRMFFSFFCCWEKAIVMVVMWHFTNRNIKYDKCDFVVEQIYSMNFKLRYHLSRFKRKYILIVPSLKLIQQKMVAFSFILGLCLLSYRKTV